MAKKKANKKGEEIKGSKAIEELQKSKKWFAITEEGYAYSGFESFYEIIGFVDLRIDARKIREELLKALKE